MDYQCPPAIHRSDLSDCSKLTKKDLSFCLTRFVTEVKKLNGENYLPCTVYQMIICIQMYLKDPEFIDLYYAIDNLMKEHTSEGHGHVNSSDIITLDSENLMWESGLVGDRNPKQLSDTVIFLLGIHCMLRGGKNIRN